MGKIVVGDRLRRMRTDTGLMGKQVAERLGWQASKVTRIEQGKHRPSKQDIALLVGACGADIEEVDALWHLLHLPDDEPDPPRPIPQLVGVSISDATMTRLLNWAIHRGYTADEAIIVLLRHANAGDH